MKKNLLICLITIISSLSLFSQSINLPFKRNSKEAKNNEELIAILNQNNEINKALLDEKLDGKPRRTILADGGIMEVVGITQNGLILYNSTFNIGAARTISTDKVWSGGGLGFSLSGQGMPNRLGVWDGGGVLLTHQEFQGRATQMDAPSGTIEHATHVAGTMIGGGVDVNAKGGAYQATIKCYDWTDDDAEMTTAAAVGLLISNHSYGIVCGWNYNSSSSRYEWHGDYSASQTEDYKFGLYSQTAADWDQICFSNPFYLPFRAAGNDRGDNASGTTWYYQSSGGGWVQGSTTSKPAEDGQYDCIPLDAVGKNIMTIGAVNKIGSSNNNVGWTKTSDVVMSTFSGWGPTDDGRIKPDVVACGVNVYSSTNTGNAGYASLNGTSMATPNASGSALLIQQYYNSRKGSFMKSSSLKGLIIHTADEAGNAGPDYTYGWGLMNTAKAVQHIQDSTNNILLQATLNSGSSYTYSFVSDGTKPIKATICWTDPAGNAFNNVVVDPTTLMLVNDLDIRLKRVSDNTIFQPYVLNPATPNAAATLGDNFRDNVEQLNVAAPQAGTYVLTITHKNTLTNGSQNFSLLLSGRTTQPGAAMNVTARTLCSSQSITFTDVSAGATSRKWYFPGGNPNTSTAVSPTINYTTAGSYPVALVVSNLTGSDSIYYTNYIIVGGIGLPLVETFEQNSTTVGYWSIQNLGGDSTWRLYNIAGNSPGHVAVGINNFDDPQGSSDYLISPVLNFAGHQSAQLSFQYAYSPLRIAPDLYSDSLVVSISTNCGNTWKRLVATAENGTNNFATISKDSFDNYRKFVPSKAADWCGGGVSPICYTVNLNSYVGLSNIKIRFEQVGMGGNNMYLDNIAITGVPFKPIANFVIPQIKICTGTPFAIIDSSLNAPDNWQWKISGVNLTSTDKNPIFTINQTGMYSVTLRISNVSGADSITKTNILVVEQGQALPVITTSRASNALCGVNDSFALNTTTIGMIQWYKNSAAFATNTNAINVNQAGEYLINVTNTNGCSAVSNKITVGASTYPPKPSISKSLLGHVFCEGSNFTLTSSSIANNQWQQNGIDIANQTAKTLSFSDSGIFSVKVNNAGCSVVSDTIIMFKTPQPITSNISGNGTANRNTTEVYSVTGGAGSTYQWNVTAGTIKSGQGTNQIQVLWSASASSGAISVTETSSNSCVGALKTKSISLFNTSANEIIKGINHIDVFPVPANDKLNLKLELNTEQNITYKIYDVLGSILFEKSMKAYGMITESINTSNLSAGIYFIEVSNDSGFISKRFVKE